MLESGLVQGLEDKTVTKKGLFERVAADFGLLAEVFEGIYSPKASVRYGCASVLVGLSAEFPEKLYPYMDRFIDLLDSTHRILVWNAMAIIANLSKVDVDKKFDGIFYKYYGFLKSGYLVTVANVAGNSAKIALAKPYLISDITRELLGTEKIKPTPHLTKECKLILATHVIRSFNSYFTKMASEEKAKVLSYVNRHRDCTRKKLRIEAEAFFKKWG